MTKTKLNPIAIAVGQMYAEVVGDFIPMEEDSLYGFLVDEVDSVVSPSRLVSPYDNWCQVVSALERVVEQVSDTLELARARAAQMELE